MPFSPTDSCSESEWTEIFERVIKPSVEQADLDYTCLRSRATRGNIVASIMESLRDAYVVVADLTDQNPNVFYELGVRHVLQDRTILIAQHRRYIPFDLQAYANHVYDWRTPEGIAAFREKIRELLTDVDEAPDRADNPVRDFLKSRALAVIAPDPPTLSPTETIYAQPLAGPGSQGLDPIDLAGRVTATGNIGAVRTVVRLTRSYFLESWPARIGELNSNSSPGDRIKVDEIYDHSLPVIREFADDVGGVEEFGLVLVEGGHNAALIELLRVVEDWIALSERIWPGTTRKTVTGSPGLLALRLMCSWGAKAADIVAPELLKLLLTVPLSSLEPSGRASNLAMVDRRDLFWPEAMLDYADLGVRYLQEEPWNNPGLRRMFAGQDDYNAGLAVFLFFAALVYGARHPQSAWPLYPGFKLIPRSSHGIQRFVAKMFADESAVDAIATAIPETNDAFRAAWPERIRLLNGAALGSKYDIWSRWQRIPESIEELHQPARND
jgi:hypothetical protein